MKNMLKLLLALPTAGLALLVAPAWRPARIRASEDVQVWLTTGNRLNLLTQQASVAFEPAAPATTTTITIDDATTYQTMDGFGAAMTGSAAYLLNQQLRAGQRDSLLAELFGPDGLHFSFVRHSIGASDFSPVPAGQATGDYTYDDMPDGQTDPALANFSIARDLPDVVPMLRAALAKNSQLKILGTPWSAPAWMKEARADGTHSLRGGGYLNTAYYQVYANYFVKYVQQYAAQGLPIYAVTLQNEPRNSAAYISMRMDAGNQQAFLKNNLGPVFASFSPRPKLLVYDHNWDNPGSYVQSVLADPSAAYYADGSAWHGYSAPSGVANMSAVHNAFPDKGIWFTEVSGNASGNFAADLRWHAANALIGNTRNWAKSVLEWNLALDQNNGPLNGGYTDGRGVVTINTNTKAVSRNVEYYVLGHASKFVDPGAVRVASTSGSGGIENVAFVNPDHSRVLIVLNNGNAASTFQVSWQGQSFNYSLPAGALATYKWLPTNALATAPAAPAAGRLQVYPTIIHSELTFDYTADSAQSLPVQLIDEAGRTVALPAAAVAVRSGLNHVRLSLGSVPAGCYVLRVGAGRGQLSQRVVVQP